MRLSTRPFAAAAILAAFVASSGCGPEVDLAKSAQIVDVTSGYYDMGVVNGKSKIVPQAIVHVKNAGDRSLPGFQISATFWAAGDDAEKSEKIVQHLVAKDLAPGATSDGILLRSEFGFTPEMSRSEAFNSSYFRDFTVKVFGKVGGRIAKLGEFTVERKIVPKDAEAPTK